MATISATDVKKLRDRTGLGMMDCKKALDEAGGDMAKAEDILRKQGLKAADLRSGRAAREGRIGHYIHLNSKIGVLVEVNCETDFVARNKDFEQLVRDICMHVAATAPKYVSPDEVPEQDLQREKEIIAAQAEGKPAPVVEKIIEGKLKDFYKQVCLLDQPFVKDPSMTVKDLVTSAKAKLGENIVVRRIVRFQVGEEA
jgi:elongation factor Ts